MQWRKRHLVRYVIGSANHSLLLCQYRLGNEKEKGEDQSAEEESEYHERDTQDGDESRIFEQNGEALLTNGDGGDDFEHLPIFQQTPAGLVHIPQNGFFPFPLLAPPVCTPDGAPPLADPPEGNVGGCYVNGLWIPNSELFKYGIHPPPNAQSSTLVYHPNVPWVRLRPVPGPPHGPHHNQHQYSRCNNYHQHDHHDPPAPSEEGSGLPPPPVAQLHQGPLPTIPPNAQYLLYFTRKAPPWYQTHPRDRDHNWRRRHNPSPYWSFNHNASVHHAPPPPSTEWNGDEFGALSRHNDQGCPSLTPEDQCYQEVVQVPAYEQSQGKNYEPTTPYIYPGYTFGQPVFTAPVFPISKTHSESQSTRESPSTSRGSDGESSSWAAPETSVSSPASSSSRPSVSLASEVVKEEEDKEEPDTGEPVAAPPSEDLELETKEERLLANEPSQQPPAQLPAAKETKVVAVPTTQSSPAQKSKKKKKRKKTRSSEMEKLPEKTPGNGLPSSELISTLGPVKPDTLDLKREPTKAAPATCSAKLTNGQLPNFKIDTVASLRDEESSGGVGGVNHFPDSAILSKPFLEFADRLLRSTLELAREQLLVELQRDRPKVLSSVEEAIDGGRADDLQGQNQVPKSPANSLPPVEGAGEASAAPTLASTPLGLVPNTSPDEHGTEWRDRRSRHHSNLDQTLRGTFAEKLAEQVIRDSRLECRQSGQRPKPVSLPPAVAPLAVSCQPPPPTTAPVAAAVARISAVVSPKKVDDEEEGIETTVEDKLPGGQSILIDWNGLVDAADTSFSQLHQSIRPSSVLIENGLVDSSEHYLVDNRSDGAGPTCSPPVGNHTSPKGDHALFVEENVGVVGPDVEPVKPNRPENSLVSTIRNRVVEEFADRMLYEIAVSITDDLSRATKTGNEEREADDPDIRAAVPSDDHQRDKWSDNEMDSLDHGRRYSVDSYPGGEKYEDEATAHYLSHLLHSDILIQETEHELKSLSSRVLAANHSIYKLAYDEAITDQSETDDNDCSPYSSLTPSVPEPEETSPQKEPYERTIMLKDILPQRSEILVHEADSTSEAGSEDVELIPHRYENGAAGEKHIYVNRLSLATELLRTQEELPYDDEFKPVTDQPPRSDIFNGSELPVTKMPVGKLNQSLQDEMRLEVVTSGPRASTMSVADSGVQSEEEDSGDEVAQEATEGQKDRDKVATASEEDKSQVGKGNRRMGSKPALFGTVQSGGGPFDPCLCCCVM